MPHHNAHHRVRLFNFTKKRQRLIIKRLVLAMAIIEPIMTLPQIYDIWIKRQAHGVSVLTWSLYLSAAVVWLLYGLQLKDRPLIISSTLWIFTEILVVIGTLRYT